MTRATGPLFDVHFRRRREGRTNYGSRLALLKGKTPRLVIRKLNKGVLVQLVEYSEKGGRRTAEHAERGGRRPLELFAAVEGGPP